MRKEDEKKKIICGDSMISDSVISDSVISDLSDV
jgi:hypothetical protein